MEYASAWLLKKIVKKERKKSYRTGSVLKVIMCKADFWYVFSWPTVPKASVTSGHGSKLLETFHDKLLPPKYYLVIFNTIVYCGMVF